MASLHRSIARNMFIHGYYARRVKRPARWTPKPNSKPRNPIQAAQMAAHKPKRTTLPKLVPPVRRVHPQALSAPPPPPAPKPVVNQQQTAILRERQQAQQRSLITRAKSLFRRQKKG